MNNLEKGVMANTASPSRNEYDSEPVVYCKQCLSLAIRTSDGIDFCDMCGGTDTEEIDIFEWEKKYVSIHNNLFLNEHKNLKNGSSR